VKHELLTNLLGTPVWFSNVAHRESAEGLIEDVPCSRNVEVRCDDNKAPGVDPLHDGFREARILDRVSAERELNEDLRRHALRNEECLGVLGVGQRTLVEVSTEAAREQDRIVRMALVFPSRALEALDCDGGETTSWIVWRPKYN
jgi:hypothetical protein